MVNYFRNKEVRFGIFILLCLSLTIGCKDDISLVGGSLMPEGDLIQGSTHHLQGILAKNVNRGACGSDNIKFSVLGDFNDPVFGNVNCGYAARIGRGAYIRPRAGAIDAMAFKLDESYVLDSCQLLMVHDYNDWYGEKWATQKLSVYELTDFPSQLNSDTTNLTDKYLPTSIGDTLWSAAKNMFNASTNLQLLSSDTIRITLNKSFGNRLLNLDTATVNSTTEFRKILQGVYIKSELKGFNFPYGSLIRIYSAAYGSGIMMYFHSVNTTTTTNDTTHRYRLFPLTKEEDRLNIFTHSVSSSLDFTPAGDVTRLGTQGLAGTSTNILLPDSSTTNSIYNWRDSLASPDFTYKFSSVTLELFVDTTLSKISQFPLPTELSLMRSCLDSLGAPVVEAPYYFTLRSDSTYKKDYSCFVSGSGELDKSTYSYKFVLKNDFFTRIVMRGKDVLEGEGVGPIAKLAYSRISSKENSYDFSSLFIEPTNPIENIRRVVFYGVNNPDPLSGKNISFKIRYVKYKKQ